MSRDKDAKRTPADPEGDHEVTGLVTGEVHGTVTSPDGPGRPARDEQAPGFSATREEDDERKDTPRDPFSPDDPRFNDGEGPARADAEPEDDEDLADEDLTDENGLPLTDEEKRELAMPVAAVPLSVNMDEIEAVDGFRLPRDQPEAERARRLAEAEAEDASRPEVAQRLADEAKNRADEAVQEAEQAQARADQAKADYEGPDRPPLHEGWRYVKPEPDPHEPA